MSRSNRVRRPKVFLPKPNQTKFQSLQVSLDATRESRGPLRWLPYGRGVTYKHHRTFSKAFFFLFAFFNTCTKYAKTGTFAKEKKDLTQMYKNHLKSLDHELTIRSNSQVTVLFDAPIVLTWPTKMKTWNAVLYKIIEQRLRRIRITSSLSIKGLKLEGFSYNFKTMILEICFEELAFIFFSPRLFIMLAIISIRQILFGLYKLQKYGCFY